MSNVALKISPDEPIVKEPVVKEVPKQSAPLPPEAPLAPQKPLRGRIVRYAIIGAVLATAGYFGYQYWTVGRFQVSTDDAYVQADMSLIGNKLAGYVKELPVRDNTAVKAGDVIARFDSSDYDLALASAKARVETQAATIATIAQQIVAQQAQIKAADSQLTSAQANEQTAAIVQARASELLKSKVGTQQTMDTTTGTLLTARASVDTANANLEAAKAQIGILNAQSNAAQKLLEELNIAVKKAENDLNYTDVKAPFDGIVANRAIELGQFVGAGTRLMAVVPVQDSYILANFKETQLVNIHPGQKVEIVIDAFDSEKIEGVVESIAPASGADFSLLPPENATGNFTKITQRFPVKISLAAGAAAKLRSGLSVAVTIDSRDAGK
jgi:membrane fusion protein, multidrug efflux system